MSLYYKCDLMYADLSGDRGVATEVMYGHNAMSLTASLIRKFTTRLNITGYRPVHEIFYILNGRPTKIGMRELMKDAYLEAMYEASEEETY